MKKITLLLFFLGVLWGGPLDFGGGSADTSFVDKATVALEKRVKDYPGADRLYRELFYTPVWVGKKGPTSFGKALLKRIQKDRTIPPMLGLKEDAKKLQARMKELYASRTSLGQKIEMELALSRLYLNYMHYLLYGGIDWPAFDAKRKALEKKYNAKVGWDYYRPKMTPASLLVEATLRGDLNAAFDKAEPKRFRYRELKKALVRYLDIAKEGGWKPLPPFKSIKPGTSNPAIVPIRKHLRLVGDLRSCESPDDSPVYDPCLQKAVKRFKLRHGLKGTAVIDRATRRWLNVPVAKKILLMRLNLDRIKWLWREEAPIRIELNIPSFRLYFYEGRHLVDTMRVITGKPNHPTPSFHNVMKYIVVNPYWKIPESIVKQEMLKHLIRDPYYYERRGKILKRSWDENSPRVDPGTVNWAKYRAKDKHIPYYFMQVPGSRNALGKIKFLFPNGYSVYIHDTPTKKLFFRNERAFSHGCMRIQKPRELLKVLALYNDNIDVDAIMARLGTKEKKTIGLKRRVPVDITYLTAYIDPYGNLNFRKDIYHYDKYQLEHYAYNPGRAGMAREARGAKPAKKPTK
ncbi:L,D-transpeptidase family protein [Nitratifractor sp.]